MTSVQKTPIAATASRIKRQEVWHSIAVVLLVEGALVLAIVAGGAIILNSRAQQTAIALQQP